jgi:hypothetical protein
MSNLRYDGPDPFARIHARLSVDPAGSRSGSR